EIIFSVGALELAGQYERNLGGTKALTATPGITSQRTSIDRLKFLVYASSPQPLCLEFRQCRKLGRPGAERSLFLSTNCDWIPDCILSVRSSFKARIGQRTCVSSEYLRRVDS